MANTQSIALEELPGSYSIHRLPPANSAATAAIITEVLGAPTTLFALLKSPDELSMVCDETLNKTLIAGIKGSIANTSGPWRALRVVGELDFALTGILASLTAPLAQASIPVFAVSSYNTDYLLVSADNSQSARDTLTQAGFAVAPRRESSTLSQHPNR